MLCPELNHTGKTIGRNIVAAENSHENFRMGGVISSRVTIYINFVRPYWSHSVQNRNLSNPWHASVWISFCSIPHATRNAQIT